jgi:tRNA(Ile2) C34 agmatinyltransferase TiaS
VPQIEFTGICPQCNGTMAKGNKFCCQKCFDEWQANQILTNARELR